MDEDPGGVQEAVERIHSCRASLADVHEVLETFKGETAWHGYVHAYDIQDHPEATICYAWSVPLDGSTNRRYYAILKLPPIESPGDAVKAAIVRAIEEGEIPIGSG